MNQFDIIVNARLNYAAGISMRSGNVSTQDSNKDPLDVFFKQKNTDEIIVDILDFD